MIQHYFYALKMGTKFIHKGKHYAKVGEELAFGENGDMLFEGHWGCLVKPEVSATLPQDSIRVD